MTQRLLLLAALPALLVGGCMGTENRGLESVHQPVVARASYAFDLATAGGFLASGEQQRLVGWMDSMHLGYGDHVAIEDPATASAARDQVARITARYGVLLATDAPLAGPPVAPGTLRVVVSRMHAGTPGCPDWSRDSSVDYDQNTSSNYGCATNANLAAMIARPEDLVHGRENTENNDPTFARKAIEALRTKGSTAGATGGAK